MHSLASLMKDKQLRDLTSTELTNNHSFLKANTNRNRRGHRSLSQPPTSKSIDTNNPNSQSLRSTSINSSRMICTSYSNSRCSNKVNFRRTTDSSSSWPSNSRCSDNRSKKDSSSRLFWPNSSRCSCNSNRRMRNSSKRPS